jgi:hypothetical protein
MSQARDGGGPMVGPMPATRSSRRRRHSVAHRAPEPTNPTPETTDRIQDTTNQPPRQRIGLRRQRIERRADTSSAGADIPVPEAGGRVPPHASSTPTRAPGRPSGRVDCRSCRTTRGADDSSSEGAGWRLQRAVGPPSACLRTPSSLRHRGADDSPAAGMVRSRERRSAGRSNDLHAPSTRVTGRSKQLLIPASAACGPSSPCQFTVPSYPSSVRCFDPIITLHRRSALAYARAPIGPACGRIFIEHAMFRTLHQNRSAALLCELHLACKVWHT